MWCGVLVAGVNPWGWQGFVENAVGTPMYAGDFYAACAVSGKNHSARVTAVVPCYEGKKERVSASLRRVCPWVSFAIPPCRY